VPIRYSRENCFWLRRGLPPVNLDVTRINLPTSSTSSFYLSKVQPAPQPDHGNVTFWVRAARAEAIVERINETGFAIRGHPAHFWNNTTRVLDLPNIDGLLASTGCARLDAKECYLACNPTSATKKTSDVSLVHARGIYQLRSFSTTCSTLPINTFWPNHFQTLYRSVSISLALKFKISTCHNSFLTQRSLNRRRGLPSDTQQSDSSLLSLI
jgi:hypothetical protein